jgi:Uma2 family endonuclease
MAVEIARRRFTISEFEKMIRKGVFEEDERIELIDGEIVDMSPIELAHMVCVSRLNLWFTSRLGQTALVWVQNAIRMPNNTRPQPDIVLLKWRDDLYAGKHPTEKDVLLMIEVAASSLNYDRKVKGPRYAAAGIPEYWIINLPKSIVEVYSGLNQGRYENVRTAGRGELLPLPNGLEGSISVDDIFG